jgi:hypothetical protein
MQTESKNHRQISVTQRVQAAALAWLFLKAGLRAATRSHRCRVCTGLLRNGESARRGELDKAIDRHSLNPF